MGFYSYRGVSDQELDAQHTTSTGETYTLRHNESLKVEMQYLGKGNPSANAQGWERSSSRYFNTLLQNHPEMFSKKNEARVRAGHNPLVDQKMINANPGWARYRGQPLVHHHIGGDGEAVALPKNAHKGKGEIHNAEKAAGITENCKNFSRNCSMRPDSVGKFPSKLHAQAAAKGKGRGQADTGRGAGSGNPLGKGRSDAEGSTRGRAASSAGTRSESVRRSSSEGNKENGTSRSESVRNHTAEAGESSGASRSISRGDCVRGSGEGKGTGSSQGNSHGASAGSGGSGQGHASGGGGQSRG